MILWPKSNFLFFNFLSPLASYSCDVTVRTSLFSLKPRTVNNAAPCERQEPVAAAAEVTSRSSSADRAGQSRNVCPLRDDSQRAPRPLATRRPSRAFYLFILRQLADERCCATTTNPPNSWKRSRLSERWSFKQPLFASSSATSSWCCYWTAAVTSTFTWAVN